MQRWSLLRFVFVLALITGFWACKTSQPVADAPPPISPKAPTAEPPELSGKDLPALLSKAEGDTVSRPMRLQELKMSVDVNGLIARTTLDMTFYNPLDQVLEGQFFVPLADGQQIARFAMEVEQELREAVVVPKEQARIAYESTTRRNIDPGLLEWAAGNTFKARIFPIPAKGTKRVLIAIESTLEKRETGYHYQWPVSTPDSLTYFTTEINLAPPASQPLLQKDAWPNNAFSEDSTGSFHWQYNARNIRPQTYLAFTIPQTNSEPQAWLEKDENGQIWFMIQAEPDLYQKEAPAPRELGILWDISHSAHKRDTAKELAFLEAYLAQMKPRAITIYPFHARQLPSKRFGSGENEQAISYLRNLAYDGATDLGCLELQARSEDAYLLFSDGLSNLGEGRLESRQTPVTVLHSSLEVDLAKLDRIASLSGGHRIDLSRTEIADALGQLTFQPFRFLGASYGDEIEAVFPQGPHDFQGSLLLTGKLEEATGDIALRFGYGQTITQTMRLHLEEAQAVSAKGLIARRWAQQHIATLNPDYRQYADSIQALGQRFGIPTRQTSLLVLDALEDYVRFRIEPPQHMMADYVLAVEAEDRKKRTELLTHLDKVVEQWETRKTWWEADYEIPPGMFKPDPAKKSVGASDDDEIAYAESAAPAGGLADLREEELRLEPDQGAATTDATGIVIKPWEPQLPYIDSLKEGLPADWYVIYLRQKQTYGAQPGFYLDVARYFQENDAEELAFRVLSNLAELGLADHELLRVLGRQLQQNGHLETAAYVFESVLELRPEEPQSFRDMGLVKADQGQYQAAVEYLYEVVRQPWDTRFPEINLLCNHELNAIAGQSPTPLNLSQMDQRLIADLPTDLRVVLDWDTDRVDMDLWVTDPRNEKCYYAHNATAIGGQISADFTGGYGPEEFIIKQAMPGTWKVQVNYYGARTQRLTGPVHIQCRLIRDYGRPNEAVKAVTLRLAKESEVLDIGEIVVE